MASNETFLITKLGLSSHETRVLQTICLISKNRPRTYELGSAETSHTADFVIVDGDDPQAMAAWERYQSSNPMVPAVMVTTEPGQGQTGYQLRRPLMATRLLAVLDDVQVCTERPAFAPAKAVETEEAKPAARPLVAKSPAAPPVASRLRALVVDDSFPIRRQIELELAHFAVEVDLAEDGEQALERIAARSYDIVFLDVVLPGMDGYKICKTIKRDKRTKGTPVIMLTGKSSPFDRVRGKLAGCDTYLTKPVDHATFEKVVRKYLSQGKPAPTDTGYALGRPIAGPA